MPTLVCDRTPCDSLDATLQVLAKVRDEEHIDIIVAAQNGKFALVTLKYCPFCGTRIGPDATEPYLPPRGRR